MFGYAGPGKNSICSRPFHDSDGPETILHHYRLETIHRVSDLMQAGVRLQLDAVR
jgi:hypothetical protein